MAEPTARRAPLPTAAVLFAGAVAGALAVLAVRLGNLELRLQELEVGGAPARPPAAEGWARLARGDEPPAEDAREPPAEAAREPPAEAAREPKAEAESDDEGDAEPYVEANVAEEYASE